MDGNANIINAIADGIQIQCPKCKSMNDGGSRFCMCCGTSLVQSNKTETVPFAAISEPDSSDPEKSVHREGMEAVPFKPLTDNGESEELSVGFQPDESLEPLVMPLKPIQYELNTEQVVEEVSAFAKGLPAWDIVPPNAAVRRRLK